MADVAQLIVDQNAKTEARKRDFVDAASAFAVLFDDGKVSDVNTKKQALQNLCQKGKVYFSCVESCIVVGCVAGAFDHPTWRDDQTDSAEKVLGGVLTLYGNIRKHRDELGFTVNSFEPSGNIFTNMQGIVALCRPVKAKQLKQQFIDANLPYDGFDRPLKFKPMIPEKNNPWISGSFYLFAIVAILAVLATIVKILNPWILPPLILGGLLLVTVVSAFQLRNDERLSEKGFLTLMIESFKRLPLLKYFWNDKKTK
jgi:hypothetical protein